MRKRYIQDPRTLELIPADEYVRPASKGPLIMGDIQPYKSMITGEMINGRRQHREHLRQHNCIEIGNEKPKPIPRQHSSARQDVLAAVRRHLG